MKGLFFTLIFCITSLGFAGEEEVLQQMASVEKRATKKIEHRIDLQRVFNGAPSIYLILSMLSVCSMGIWTYTLLTTRTKQVIPRFNLRTDDPEKLKDLCRRHQTLYTALLSHVIDAKEKGFDAMVETMRFEGKRLATPLWQRIHIINDVAVIAPMLGLLGTVLGMFYAFYDTNSSTATLITLFDGLGVSVGTTVAGLIVSLFSMGLYLTAKFHLTRLMNSIESETLAAIRHLHKTENPLKQLLNERTPLNL